MFTGIVEEIGTVRTITQGRNAATLEIHAYQVLEEICLGDSIAVNGVCVTVTNFTEQTFTADLMPETLNGTSLSLLKPGTPVNLERALRADSRLGGHFVSGHVDCTAVIRSRWNEGNALYLELNVPSEYSPYLIPKGSVALEGTSLTVFGSEQGRLTVSLVPHTKASTVLGDKMPGDPVNLECDLLAKYAERLLQPSAEKKAGLTLHVLKENGYV